MESEEGGRDRSVSEPVVRICVSFTNKKGVVGVCAVGPFLLGVFPIHLAPLASLQNFSDDSETIPCFLNVLLAVTCPDPDAESN
eukprot:752819-Hanusia_phi.AAC.3